MSLTLGRRLGPYEVLAPLGAGGMGEVFRARDVRLDRVVALKVLPRAFASDPERLARFEREAKLLAALNHPNVGAIYGLEDADGTPCLVLEYVEGESLAQRLGKGPLPVREAIETVRAIAAGVEAAHERSIVHRDLKPGNVMVTADGAVKVLDFGLARGGATVASSSAVDLSLSPTVAVSPTGAGTILGTAAYMSPEQARGRTADARTDVWALGCILYECLAGVPAFRGETATDVIAAVLGSEPDWTRLPARVPPRLQTAIRASLAKDPETRTRTVAEVRRELSAIGQEMSSASGIAKPAAPAPSLAVLYFENLAHDPESDYFCAGITEDILTDLSKIRGLRVASKNAVARYRGGEPDLARVATDLQVGAVLQGSVRRAGDRVRITAQLVSASDGFQLWAERFDRTMQDVFAVQEEIASAIASALRVALSPDESEAIGRNRPQDVRAYDLYLRGREQYGHYSPESLKKAMALFEEATRIDSTYALAYAGIADCYGQFIQWQVTSDPDEAFRLGQVAADHALGLDPRLAEAWKAKALLYNRRGDRERSLEANLKALEISPRFLPALVNYAVGLFVEGNVAGAERAFRRTLEIDPQETFALSWVTWVESMTDRSEEAVARAAALRAATDDPFYVTMVHGLRAGVQVRRGDVAAVETCMRQGLDEGVTAGQMKPFEAWIALGRERREEARGCLDECARNRQLVGAGVTVAAIAAIRLGDLALAVRIFDRPVFEGLKDVIARLDPELHPLLDLEPFAPRRSASTLVWPLEAPMPRASVHAKFREVRIESGRPQGSQLPFLE